MDKLMNDEADRFLNDMNQSGYLAYRFYQKITYLDIPETFKSSLDSWLNSDMDDIAGTTYATDTDHLISRIEESLNSRLDMWKGSYRLASNNGQVFNLKIAGPDKKDKSGSKKARVYINGINITEYTFENKVLSWDRQEAKLGSTIGKLVFSNLADQDIKEDFSASDYFGHFCEGSVTMSKGLDEIKVKGKQGVYSPTAILGDYSETDNLDFWAGTYDLYGIVTEGVESKIGDLIINPKQEGQE